MPPVGRVGATGGGPQEWFYSMPPVTRTLGAAVLAATCLATFGMVSPIKLMLSWPLIKNKFEIWRLATNFVFFGGFSFNFAIQLYMLVQYASRYEVSPFNTGAGGTSADFVWMLVVGGAVLCVAGVFLELPFMGQAMTFMILYAWSRKNPDVNTSVFMFQVKGFYLPWALTAFHLLIGNDVVMPLLGIGAGHVYWFLHYVAPATYQIDVIKTPAFLIQWFGGVPSRPSMTSGGGGARGGMGGAQQQPQAAPARPYAGHSWGSGRTLGRE